MTTTITNSNTKPIGDVKLHLVDDVNTAFEFIRWLGEDRNRRGLSFDTETGGLRADRDPLRLAQIGDTNDGWAIPWDQWGGVAKEAFDKYNGDWILHNRPFDAGFALQNGLVKRWPWERSHCTMVMAHCLDPSRKKALKSLTAALVDKTAAAGQDALNRYMRANDYDWNSVPIDNPYYWGYGAMDAVLTSRLFDVLEPQMLGECQEVYQLELAVQRICANMTMRGTLADLEYCDATAQMLRQWVDEARTWAKKTFGIKNVTSAMQSIKVFEEDGIEFTELTATGRVKLDKEILLNLDHPLADAILKIRKAEKLCSTYLDNFKHFADSRGYIHPTIWTCGTRTARMSITDPALQTLHKDDKTVRNGIVPDDGCKLITCDADQIEMRLMAHFARDDGLIEAFAAAAAAEAAGSIDPVEIDFFCRVATEMYGTLIDKKNPLRKITKNSSYARLYGAGAEKIAMTAGVPIAKIEEINALMDERFPGVRQFMKETEREVMAHLQAEGRGYVTAYGGRKLPVDRGKEYTGTNYKIQCSAATVFKRGLVAADAAGYGDYMLLPVHDEIVLSVPDAEAVEAQADIARVMTEVSRDEFLLPITWSADLLPGAWGGRELVVA